MEQKRRPTLSVSLLDSYLVLGAEKLLCNDILIHVLRANQSVEEQICKTCYDNPVACEVVATCYVYDVVLNQWQDTTTANQGHKDT